VMARATQRQHEQLEAFLVGVQRAARRQVMIEATIVEVTLAVGIAPERGLDAAVGALDAAREVLALGEEARALDPRLALRPLRTGGADLAMGALGPVTAASAHRTHRALRTDLAVQHVRHEQDAQEEQEDGDDRDGEPVRAHEDHLGVGGEGHDSHLFFILWDWDSRPAQGRLASGWGKVKLFPDDLGSFPSGEDKTL